MKTCTVCGREYKRPSCEFCNREGIWSRQLYYPILAEYFTPRIAQDIEKHNPDVKAEHINRSLFIMGGLGSGKTIYAAALMLASMKRSYITKQPPVNHLFVSVPTLLQGFKATYEPGFLDPTTRLTEVELLLKYTSVDFLVLDDLGVEKVSDWVLQMLYLIINQRYENLKITVFTSNFSLNELAEHLGSDRIPSRIHAMCEVVDMGDRDLRLERREMK